LEESGKREVLEGETGYRLKEIKFIGTIMIVGKNESFFDACLLVKVDSKLLKQVCEIKDVECDEWLWFSKSEIKKLNL